MFNTNETRIFQLGKETRNWCAGEKKAKEPSIKRVQKYSKK